MLFLAAELNGQLCKVINLGYEISFFYKVRVQSCEMTDRGR